MDLYGVSICEKWVVQTCIHPKWVKKFSHLKFCLSKHGHILILLRVHAQMGGPIWLSRKQIISENTLHCP
jgi:hypothetical protein